MQIGANFVTMHTPRNFYLSRKWSACRDIAGDERQYSERRRRPWHVSQPPGRCRRCCAARAFPPPGSFAVSCASCPAAGRRWRTRDRGARRQHGRLWHGPAGAVNRRSRFGAIGGAPEGGRKCPGRVARGTMAAPPVATGRGCIRPSHVQAAGAWKVGPERRPRSRRPGKPADGEAPAMAGNRRLPNGCMAIAAPAPAEEWTGTETAVTRAPQGGPGDPRGPRERRTRSQGGQRRPPGAGGQPALGSPMGRPRTRRTPRRSAGEGRRRVRPRRSRLLRSKAFRKPPIIAT